MLCESFSVRKLVTGAVKGIGNKCRPLSVDTSIDIKVWQRRHRLNKKKKRKKLVGKENIPI